MSQVAVARALRLLDAISDAFTTRDWERLRSLYHDQARISSVAGGDRILSPDELIEVLAGIEGGSYSTDDAETEALDENAVVVSGLVRQRDDVGAMFTPSAWVLTFHGGLVWRSRAYASIDEARAAYGEHGRDLGISYSKPERLSDHVSDADDPMGPPGLEPGTNRL
jgi:hypothetical protein